MLKQWLTIVILVFLISCGNDVSDGQNSQNADGSDSLENFISTGNGNIRSADSFEPYVNPYEGYANDNALRSIATIDITNLSQWIGFEDYYFIDAAGDQSGNSIDLLGIWLVHDDDYMYIRWDAKLPNNQNQMVSTAFGLGFSNRNSNSNNPPPTRDCVFWVAFNSAGTVTQVNLADATHSVSVPTPITNSVARFGEGANGNYVSLVSKIPWSLFIDLGYGNITAQTAFPMWGERLASGSFTANVQDRVPDAGFFFYNADDGTVSAIGGTYSNEKNILTYSLPGQTGNAVIDDVTGTIMVYFPSSFNFADLDSLIATFTLSNEATSKVAGISQVSGITVNDFSGGTVTYIVRAEDGTTREWTVTAVILPDAGNSGITNQEQGANGSKEVELTITLQNDNGDPLPGFNAGDITVKIDGGAAVNLSGGAFSGFTDNGDGTYTVIYTGNDHGTSYDFTDLTVAGVVVEAGPTSVVTPPQTKYTVRFEDYDGTLIKTEQVGHGSDATAPADPVRVGYTFTGWDTVFTNVTGPLTVTAQYTINQYTITFNSNGGSAVAPITQNFGTAVVAPADPTRAGYTFNGWDPVVPGTMPEGGSSHTAQWTDINECNTANGGCAQNCNNTAGSYNCSCDAGYTLNGDGKSCDGINECDLNTDNCDANATCANTAGSFTCTCNTGYTGSGTTCDDINECNTANGGCAQNCNNTAGSYSCSCDAGYTLNVDGKACDDIDECDLNTDNCDANATCANTAGSFTCSCNFGYDGDGVTCSDIDECGEGTDSCNANAACSNTAGGYDCTCNSGYEGDGYTCSDIDECDLNTDNCDANATCANTAGSFTCSCNFGYDGDGVTCSDIDECDEGTDGCDANAACSNTAGGYDCTCNGGYEGDGYTCSDVDECDLNTDNCDQNCANTVGGFTCSCEIGYELNVDGHTCDDIAECGNGIVEPGEECETSEGTCCTSECKLAAADTVCRAGVELCEEDAKCDGISGTCPENAPKAENTPCRDSAGECDIDDFCNGVDITCEDKLVADETPCAGEGYTWTTYQCMSGICESTGETSGTCTTAIVISSYPYENINTTEGRPDHVTSYGTGCDEIKGSSSDVVYSLVVKGGNAYRIKVDGADDFAVAVLGACADEETCIDAVDGNDGGTEETEFTASSDSTLVLVVESISGGGGYTLTVEEIPAEEPDDGDTAADDDADTGDTGDTGNTGDTGDTGNTGNTGDTGSDPDSVIDEDTGDTQPDIDEVTDEDTGDTGNTGTDEDSGDTGNTGNTAVDEDTGDTGNTGDTAADDDSTDSDETDIDENETQDDPYEGLKISGGGCSCGLVF